MLSRYRSVFVPPIASTSRCIRIARISSTHRTVRRKPPSFIPSDKITNRPQPTPHDISLRVKHLSRLGKLDQAIELVQNLPLVAQDKVVWGTLISKALHASRYTLAFDLFTDMKKRGFRPAAATYLTVFSGLSAIEDWQHRQKSLKRVHVIYEQYTTHISSVKIQHPKSPELFVDPVNAYIQLLGNAGEYKRMWDTFNEMDIEGPMAPDKFTFSIMLRNIGRLERQDRPHQAVVPNQGTSDVRLLWQLLVKASERPSNPVVIGPYHLLPAIRILKKGKPSDQDFATELVARHGNPEGTKQPDEDQHFPMGARHITRR